MSDTAADEPSAGSDPGPPTPSTVRAVVQRADCAPNVVLLEVRVPGRTSVVIVGAPKNKREGLGTVGVLPREARQALWGARLPPASARERPREDALHGAYVLAIGPDDVAIAQNGDHRLVRAHGGRVVITDDHPAAARASARRDFVTASDEERAAWEAAGVALAEALAADAVELHRDALLRGLDRARAKIRRRREAIASDLAKIAQADRIASQAQWLVGEAARVPRGATKMEVTDWSTGEAVPMDIPLDPAKSAREQVEAMFKRAKRLRLGGRIANDRLAQADLQRDAVVRAIASVEQATTLVAMDEAAREAKRAAPRDVVLAGQAGAGSAPGKGAGGAGAGTATATGKKGQPRTPYRTFLARSGRKLLVGKGAADNDALTLHVARPHDLWLHAKDRTGAHVIVPLERGRTCPAEDLVDAAHLAAHFSDARAETAVDIQYTPKRYLRKPKGSAVGAILVDREKVLALRVDAALLASLLEREDL